MMEQDKYELINIDKLATALAEDDWAHETKERKEDELYETIVILDEHNEGVMERQIKPHWATTFFNLREQYLKLIEQFTK